MSDQINAHSLIEASAEAISRGNRKAILAHHSPTS